MPKKKPREYTGDHARAGIAAPLPEIECWALSVFLKGYERQMALHCWI